MINRLKAAGRRSLTTPAACAAARALTTHCARILCYHKFCADDAPRPGCLTQSEFRRQLAYLTEHYTIVPLARLVAAFEANQPLPPRSAVLTIDDGYTNFRDHALPVLRAFNAPATLAVCPELAEENAWIWPDRFNWLCDRAPELPELAPARRAATLGALKRLGPRERDERLAALATASQLEIPASPPPHDALLAPLELRTLANDDLMEIAAHTCTHPTLAPLPDQHAAWEITTSKRDLEHFLDHPVTTFVYPNGLAGDYRPRHAQLARAAGFRTALASHFGFATPADNLFALPRLGAATDWHTFLKYIDGVEFLQRRLTHTLS